VLSTDRSLTGKNVFSIPHSTTQPEWCIQSEVWLSQITLSMKTKLHGHFHF